MVLLILPLNVYANEETITLYMFESNTCQHCTQALNYIEEHLDKIPDNLEIVTYEVSANNDNALLMNEVAEYLEVDTSKNFGTPFFVIGTEYNKGYVPGDWEELFKIANDYAENGDYEDVVKKVISDEDLKVEARALEDIINIPNPIVTIIVYSIFGVIIVGFIAMILFSRK